MCMCMLTKRTHILLDQSVWEKLVKDAKKKKISVGNLIRQSVEEKYFHENRDREVKEANEEIKKIRPHFKGRIDYKELINYGRK